MNMKEPKKRVAAHAVMAMLLLSGAYALQSCSDDALTGQPGWLGNSIYERLQEEGNYTYTLRLIDDLGQTDVLRQTGSKTLFVADDAAFEAFFQSNDWGVRRYEDMSEAQKKLLLNSSMINNAYLIELLSNVSGNPPEEGQCMRRETAVSVYDSVARFYPSQMPSTAFWTKYKNRQNGIVLLRDNTTKPMIHFLPAYMRMKNITNEDLSTLTNGVSNSISDAWVNGKKIIDRDITCKNGYIHKVDGVMTSSDNMVGIIGSHANMSTFYSLLNRFSAPYYDDASTKEYDRLYNTTDSVFTLKYFAETANTSGLNVNVETAGNLKVDPDGNVVDAQLSFDPGWNQYMYTNTAGYDLHYDAGAMLVPSNKALDYWWNHDGKVIQDMYHSWENVPLKVLVKLMNINMINTFSETVPSKFANIVDNTTKTSLGITTADVDSCFMGCNGVVYLTNKVFTPADYSSVSFPALINQDLMSVIYWGIENLNFEPYLNSMDSKYSFIIPTNNAMLSYVDPCSYGQANTVLFQFYYDDEAKTVRAHRYNYNVETKSIDTGRDLSDATTDQIKDRLEDLLNNIIIVGDVEDGHTFYKTKGGSTIRVRHAGQAGTMTVEGGWQIEHNDPVTVSTIYEERNGKAYVVDGQMPLSSSRSVYSMLRDHPEFSEFYALVSGLQRNFFRSSDASKNNAVDQNVYFFDAFNYTVYVPTNASLKKLHDDGILPNWDDYENLTANDFGGNQKSLNDAKNVIYSRINNFVRYHIQDNSIFIGGEPVGAATENGSYETFTINPSNRRFFSVGVEADDNSLTVTDQLGEVRHVVKTDGLYNMMGREFWVKNQGKDNSEIYNASDVVVHQIDGTLLYSQDQLTPWRTAVGLAKAHHAYRKTAKR